MKPSSPKKGRVLRFLKAASIGIGSLIVLGLAVMLMLRSGPAYWIKQLGRHYIPNEIFGRSSRTVPEARLRGMGAAKVVPAATRLLSSEVWHKQAGAADALTLFGAAGEPATGELVLLIEKAGHFFNESPAALAGDALVNIHRDSGKTPPEVQRLLSSANPSVRALGCGLALRIEPTDLRFLAEAVKLLQSDSGDRDARRDAAQAKSVLCYQLAKSPAAARLMVPELCNQLTTIAPPAFQPVAALKALAVTAPDGVQALPVIIDFMGSSDNYENSVARDAFVAFGRESVRRLAEVLAVPNRRTQKSVFFAVKTLGKQALEAVLEAKQHSDPVVRANAQGLLAQRQVHPENFYESPEPVAEVSAFNEFLKQVEIKAPAKSKANQDGTVIRFMGRNYSDASEGGGFVLFAVLDDQVIICRRYAPWESTEDIVRLRQALEWLPKNACLVFTGYGLDKSTRSALESSYHTNPYRITSELRKWGGDQRLHSLPAQTAYLLIGVDSGLGASAVEITSAREPVTYPAPPR